LENVLRSLRETTSGRVIVLFGCGGDRDSTKRPEMGKVATRFAHHSIITSDNPRSEDPEEIIRQILSGVEGDAYTVVSNRTEAIRTALRMATPGDTVLLAGKGHETWQIFSDRVLQYDEREIAREILKEEGY
jgi:UDP-N-acetylmuramoyl-L-alanyl-D-glutamate--2,6-diaminopimelate ligase